MTGGQCGADGTVRWSSKSAIAGSRGEHSPVRRAAGRRLAGSWEPQLPVWGALRSSHRWVVSSALAHRRPLAGFGAHRLPRSPGDPGSAGGDHILRNLHRRLGALPQVASLRNASALSALKRSSSSVLSCPGGRPGTRWSPPLIVPRQQVSPPQTRPYCATFRSMAPRKPAHWIEKAFGGTIERPSGDRDVTGEFDRRDYSVVVKNRGAIRTRGNGRFIGPEGLARSSNRL